jgi:hypothetical protein
VVRPGQHPGADQLQRSDREVLGDHRLRPEHRDRTTPAPCCRTCWAGGSETGSAARFAPPSARAARTPGRDESVIAPLQADPGAPLREVANDDPVRVHPDADSSASPSWSPTTTCSIPLVDHDDRFIGVIMGRPRGSGACRVVVVDRRRRPRIWAARHTGPGHATRGRSRVAWPRLACRDRACPYHSSRGPRRVARLSAAHVVFNRD